MKINWKQIETETGITLKEIRTKGDKIFFEGLSNEDEATIREALLTHIPIKIKQPTNQEIMDKLNSMSVI